MGEIPQVDINKPLMARTSKNSKYKKKGKASPDEDEERDESSKWLVQLW